MKEEIKKILEDNESMVFVNPSYDSAIIGVTHDNRAVYDHNKMVESLCNAENMNIEEAEDFISYNTIRAIPYMGEKGPIVVYLA